MTDARKKSFVIMVAAMLVIVSLYFAVDLSKIKNGSLQEETSKEEVVVFQDTNVDKIVKLSYISEDEKITLIKDGEGKWNAKDSDVPINSAAVDKEMIIHLRYIVAEDILEKVEEVDQFGFENPLNEIDII